LAPRKITVRPSSSLSHIPSILMGISRIQTF
jgi:hypothetical protein